MYYLFYDGEFYLFYEHVAWMRHVGVKIKKNYNWDSAAGQLEALYAAALGQRPRPVTALPATASVDEKVLEAGSSRLLVAAN